MPLKKFSIALASSSHVRSLRQLAAHWTGVRSEVSVFDGPALDDDNPAADARSWLGCARLWSDIPMRLFMEAQFGDAEVLVPMPEPFALPAATVLTRKLHGRAVIPLVGDTEIAGPGPDELGAVSAFARFREWASRQSFEMADGVVFRGARLAERSIALYGEPARWIVIEAATDAAEFERSALGDESAQTELERWCDERCVVLCVGVFATAEERNTLRDGLLALGEKASASGRRPLGVVLTKALFGREYFEQVLGELPWGVLRVEDELSELQTARLLVRASVVVGAGGQDFGVPSQVVRCMAASTALVAVAKEDTDLGELTAGSRFGERVQPGNPQHLAQAIERFSSDSEALRSAQMEAREITVTRFDIAKAAGAWQEFVDDVRSHRSAERGPSRLRSSIDRAIGAAGVVLAAPILGAAALAVRVEIGGPVLFRQTRPGLRGEPFEMLKFRTMRSPVEGEDNSDASRLTPLGRWLREASIDELPALINVARGELSLVGPRPLLMRYLERYSPEQRRRMDVMPGITGWAQVNGRNAISWEEKFRHDVWYVDNRTLLRDVQILAMTVGKVLGREDISSDDHVTMPEFMEKNKSETGTDDSNK